MTQPPLPGLRRAAGQRHHSSLSRRRGPTGTELDPGRGVLRRRAIRSLRHRRIATRPGRDRHRSGRRSFRPRRNQDALTSTNRALACACAPVAGQQEPGNCGYAGCSYPWRARPEPDQRVRVAHPARAHLAGPVNLIVPDGPGLRAWLRYGTPAASPADPTLLGSYTPSRTRTALDQSTIRHSPSQQPHSQEDRTTWPDSHPCAAMSQSRQLPYPQNAS